jgi:hypothetical protein
MEASHLPADSWNSCRSEHKASQTLTSGNHPVSATSLLIEDSIDLGIRQRTKRPWLCRANQRQSDAPATANFGLALGNFLLDRLNGYRLNR